MGKKFYGNTVWDQPKSERAEWSRQTRALNMTPVQRYVAPKPERDEPSDDIIGQTNSGKDIHLDPDHPDHANFSAADYRDAADQNVNVLSAAEKAGDTELYDRAMSNYDKLVDKQQKAMLEKGDPEAEEEAEGLRLEERTRSRDKAAKGKKEKQEQSVEEGPRGGKFYRTATGAKVYVKD